MNHTTFLNNSVTDSLPGMTNFMEDPVIKTHSTSVREKPMKGGYLKTDIFKGLSWK
jgi:hypothetical protein